MSSPTSPPDEAGPPYNKGVADLLVELDIARDDAERRFNFAAYLAVEYRLLSWDHVGELLAGTAESVERYYTDYWRDHQLGPEVAAERPDAVRRHTDFIATVASLLADGAERTGPYDFLKQVLPREAADPS
jgi:hypothetical protein